MLAVRHRGGVSVRATEGAIDQVPHAREDRAIGDDSWIEDDHGAKVFKVDGEAMRLRDTFILEDPSGNVVAKIQQRKLHIRDTTVIERGGETIATVRKRVIGNLKRKIWANTIDDRSWASYMGHFKHAQSKKLITNLSNSMRSV